MSDTSQIKTPKDLSTGEQKGKRRDRSASEERLICAAIDIFSKHGYNGATTKMIAAKADVNESLIGRYFDGKEGLLLSLVERFISELCNEILPYEPQQTLEDELVNYYDFKLRTSKQKKNFGKIIISQALTDNSFRKKALERVPIFHDPNLVDRLETLKKNGALPAEVNVLDICDDLENYMHGIFIFETILQETTDEVIMKQVKRFVRHYARGFNK